MARANSGALKRLGRTAASDPRWLLPIPCPLVEAPPSVLLAPLIPAGCVGKLTCSVVACVQPGNPWRSGLCLPAVPNRACACCAHGLGTAGCTAAPHAPHLLDVRICRVSWCVADRVTQRVWQPAPRAAELGRTAQWQKHLIKLTMRLHSTIQLLRTFFRAPECVRRVQAGRQSARSHEHSQHISAMCPYL